MHELHLVGELGNRRPHVGEDGPQVEDHFLAHPTDVLDTGVHKIGHFDDRAVCGPGTVGSNQSPVSKESQCYNRTKDENIISTTSTYKE